ncbi:MAG TPA: sulfatase-like hydrolase/transferase [Polyangia bacterium]|jgi:arylsulfatase A-like enzyme|nr:sulfatase-like hydrolase/transferase [Polyangia bacterium]
MRRWAAAGLAGGAVSGAADAACAVIRGVGGLSFAKAIRLIALDASVLAVVGLLAGALVGAAAALRATRLQGPTAARWRRAPEVALALVALPLLISDARATFAGHQAAAVPGHQVISAVLVIAGLVALLLLGGVYRRWLEDASPGAPGRWLLLVGVAGAAHAVNLMVLVRLYAWFHATLALVTVVLAILAFRLRLNVIGPGRRSRSVFAGAVLMAVAACGASLAALPRSQILRFAAYERTAIVGRLLGLAPLSMRGTTVAATDRAAALVRDDRPLPDGPHRPDANLLIITIDALRADHLGAYGYRRPITPHLDALAGRATRFARAYAQAPHTSFSIASLLTGKYFATLARVAPGQFHEPVPSVMRTYGWRTAAFYPPAVFFIDGEKLQAYADSNFGFEYVKFEYLDAERRVDQVIHYYDDVKPAKSFVWVHFFEPHEPYQIHPGFDLGNGDVDRYDSEIAYVDAAVGRLLAYVEARRPNTVVVLAADHGEEFDEHGGRYHGTSLYEEQLHIPLLIAVPGVAPAVIANQVQLVDVTPTLLNVVNIPVPVRMRGTDLGPWLARPPAAADRLPPAFAEVDDRRAVIFGSEKLICDMRGGFCAYYDLARDPGERQNLADARPDRVAALRAILDRWLDDGMALEPAAAKNSPTSDSEPPPRAIERGRLNDVGAAGELAVLLASNASLDLRREAARLLATLPAQPPTAAVLNQAAADPDPAVAAWASIGAARLGDERARARVQASLAQTTPDQGQRVRGALALLSVGDRSGLSLLGQTLSPCSDVALCRDIVEALGRSGDARAVPFLIRALPEVQNRRETVVALGQLGPVGGHAARDALIDRLESDEYVPVRIEAARALVKLGDAKVAPALARAAARESEPTVAAAARQAAHTLAESARRRR